MEQVSSPANKITAPAVMQQQDATQMQAKIKGSAPNDRAAEVANFNSRVVTRAEAQQAAAAAVSAARTVVSSVTAARDQVTSSGATDVARLTRDLDAAVRSATFGGVSFIGSSLGGISVRNGDLGGRVSLQTLPMDAEGLGLADLDASIRAGGTGPELMLNMALAQASENASRLELLHGALSGATAEDAAADPASMMAAHASAAADARGVAVDLAA